MEKVLVGIDDETASQVAVDWVIERAASAPVTVQLFTAFDSLVSEPIADDARLRNAAARIEAQAPGTVVSTELADRSILEGLVERSAQADLLVIGSHPRRAVRSALTGAFPASVVVRAQCPVVVVPDDWSGGGDRIVLGVADDGSSDAAVAFAAREALAAETSLEVVHAWQLPAVSMDVVAALTFPSEQLEDAHAELLKTVMSGLADRYPGLSTRGRLLHGPAGMSIDEAIAGARMAVLGTRGHSPAMGTLLGSTVQRILHHGGVPIAVVPVPEKGDRR